MTSNKILFYRPTDSYGEFSNFSPHPIEMIDKHWPTVEHYFQAQKFHNTIYEDEIRLLPTPMEAKISGQDRSKPLRKDWEKIKDQVMYNAVHAKFIQNENLKNLLIETGNAYLAEHTKNDSYWGDGGNGKGRNMLGQILMQVREQLT